MCLVFVSKRGQAKVWITLGTVKTRGNLTMGCIVTDDRKCETNSKGTSSYLTKNSRRYFSKTEQG